jgi:hypothetical protein
MSILLTADKIATEQIFEDDQYLDFDACYAMLKSKGEISEEERAYDFIMSDIEVHANNFWPDRMTGNYKGEVWGCIENGYAVINSNVFNGMCDRGNFSRQSFLSWAARNDLLAKSSKGEPTKSKRIKGNVDRYIFLKIVTEDEASGSRNEKEHETIENTEFREVSKQEEIPFDSDL